ncbi:uncharacterized protein PFL1_02999 [Pseudozyma flocculosa PF-1]|uniref:Translation initiation factor eIF2B subunit delta n=1 Tax=Pseudozyma flocculosa PF-1 TaxID=1277687 RepID=A0A061H9V6_9BASI|nr:uncharacterized protein PFL1_02999 [Pseudozyma flocculosa PF-1]EPQ29244.1 hypothetical protein PFL1_02999 [Pseudozyma flocculosa PF-1]
MSTPSTPQMAGSFQNSPDPSSSSPAAAAAASASAPAAGKGSNPPKQPKQPKQPGQKSAKELKAERRAAKIATRPDGKAGAGGAPGAAGGPSTGPAGGAGAAANRGSHHAGAKGGRGGAGGEGGGDEAQSMGRRDDASRRSNQSQAKGQGGAKQQQQQAAASHHHLGFHESQTAASTIGGVSLFGNVSQPRSSQLHTQSIVSSSYRSNIHPSILKLSTQLSEFRLMGADSRAMGLLQALADVIRDYRTPPGEVLKRDLLRTVSNQVGHLVEARAMGTSTGVATRYLKYEISLCSADMTEDEAKEHLLERIDHFVRDRIVYAAKIIRAQAGSKIKDGDVVMTFARSTVVEGTLLAAHRQGIRFSVVVVDSRPLLEGRALLSVLLAAGIPCTYGLVSSLGALMPRATLLLLGTAALLANGALYSRAGTATCAMMAKEKGIPVIVCCETYKFSERVQLDSFVQNEAGSPRDLLTSDDEAAPPAAAAGSTVGEWEGNASLGLVNLLYDVTPPRYVSAVASEVGLSGPESVSVILRDYKSVLYGV